MDAHVYMYLIALGMLVVIDGTPQGHATGVYTICTLPYIVGDTRVDLNIIAPLRKCNLVVIVPIADLVRLCCFLAGVCGVCGVCMTVHGVCV